MWRSRRRRLITAEYDELPAVYDELEALDGAVIVHDVLKPAGTFADLKHLAGRRGTNVALDFHLRRGDVDKAFAAADRVIAHTFKTQQCLHLPFEPLVAVADPVHPGLTIHSATQTPSFVRTEIARLLGVAGKPGAGEGRVPRRRLRRQGLHQARGAGGSARPPGAPSRQGRAHHGRAVLHDHQAPDDVPHQERGDGGRVASRRGAARCCGTAAPMRTSGRG